MTESEYNSLTVQKFVKQLGFFRIDIQPILKKYIYLYLFQNRSLDHIKIIKELSTNPANIDKFLYEKRMERYNRYIPIFVRFIKSNKNILYDYLNNNDETKYDFERSTFMRAT